LAALILASMPTFAEDRKFPASSRISRQSAGSSPIGRDDQRRDHLGDRLHQVGVPVRGERPDAPADDLPDLRLQPAMAGAVKYGRASLRYGVCSGGSSSAGMTGMDAPVGGIMMPRVVV